MRRHAISVTVVVALTGTAAVFAAGEENESSNIVLKTGIRPMVAPVDKTALTVYSGFALVERTWTVNVPPNHGVVRLPGVASEIDPATVLLSLGGRATVIDQEYGFDVVNSKALSGKHVGQVITVLKSLDTPLADGTTDISWKGTLLSVTDGLVVKTADGIVVTRDYSSIVFPSMDGMTLQPTLSWHTFRPLNVAGEPNPLPDMPFNLATASYETAGISWAADHTVFVQDAQGDEGAIGTLLLGIDTHASVTNSSGADYNDASLKLVAGHVRRAHGQDRREFAPSVAMDARAAGSTGFSRSPVSEYHVYSLGRTITISDKSTKRIALVPPTGFPAVTGVQGDDAGEQARVAHPDIPAMKILLLRGPDLGRGPNIDPNYPSSKTPHAEFRIRFKAHRPLPSGRTRALRRDADGRLVLIGEDSLNHTPEGREVELFLGRSFDVGGEHKQVSFEISPDIPSGSKPVFGRTYKITEKIEVKIRNSKPVPARVTVRETMHRWPSWHASVNSATYADVKESSVDNRTLDFTVVVPAGGMKAFVYEVVYDNIMFEQPDRRYLQGQR